MGLIYINLQYRIVCAETQEAQDTLRTVALEEVVATGTRTATDVRLLPVTVSVVDQEVLTEKSSPNILPTLTEQVPGLFVTQRGVIGYGVSTGGSGGIKVRGIGGQPNTDVLVLIDGLPQYAGLYGHPIADNYQTQMAERVEVIRGPGSLYYGSNALGGVINIVTRRPKNDTIITSLHAQGGSHYSVDAGITNQLRRGKWTEAVGFNYVRTSGHRENMGFDQYSGFARLGYDFNTHWSLNATGNIAYFNTANPGTVSEPIFGSHQHVLRGMATLSAENRYERTEGAIRVYYSGGKHRINDGYKAGEEAPQTEYNHTDLMLGVSAYQTVRMFRGNSTTFGFDYQHFGGHVWNKGLTDAVPATKEVIRKTQYDLAGYVDFRQQVIEWFSLDAGVRLGWHSAAGFYYAPQAGLSFLLPQDAQLKAVVSRGFRNPTIRELYMYAPANDSLQAVNLWNYELAYKQYFLGGRIRVGANLFYLHAKNMIETRMVDGRPKNVNTGELKNAGCEVEFSARVWKGLMVGANYSYLYMVNPVLAAPEHKLNLSVGYHHDRFRIGTNLQYVHGLWTKLPVTTAGGGTVSTGSGNPVTTTAHYKQNFVLWDAHAAGRIWRELWVTLTADNLLGSEYEINAGFPMPKTTVMAGLQFSF